MSYMNYVHNGPWRCERSGLCGDIIDTRDGRFYGSLIYVNALEIVRKLNQRWRWLKDLPDSDSSSTIQPKEKP